MQRPSPPTRDRRGLAALAALLAVAATLRLWGITWGLPDATHLFSYHPDEYHSLRGLFSLLLGDLNPHFFNYGSLYLYLVGATVFLLHPGAAPDAWLAQLTQGGAQPLLRTWTLDARLVSVAAALVTVYLVFLLGRRLLHPGAGLLAAGLVAVLPLHVLLSHYGTVDVTLTMFVVLSLYLSVLYVQQPGWSTLLWAGVAAGLAASTKYNGALVLIAPLLAAGIGEARRGRLAPVAGRCLGALAAAGVAFALTSPYTLLAWSEARQSLAFELGHMAQGESLAVAAEPSALLFHVKHLLAPGMGLALLAGVAGAVEVVRRRRREAYPLVVFCGVWLVALSLANVRYPRYELPLAVTLAVLAPLALSGLSRRVQVGGAGLLLAGCLLWTLPLCARLGGPDPHQQALEYVLRQSTPEQTVGVLGQPWFADPPLDYCNGGTVISRSPLWAPYRRPVRPLVLTGLDGPELSRRRPDLFVVAEDFALADGLAAGDPATRGLAAALEADYRPAARFGGVPLPLIPWRLGQDWRYPWPQITVWQRTAPPAG